MQQIIELARMQKSASSTVFNSVYKKQVIAVERVLHSQIL